MPGTVLVVSKSGLGTTSLQDAEFGTEMLGKFFHALEGLEQKPATVCFYTEGVKMTTEGSPILATLRLLERLGVQLLVCQTCLNYYGLIDKLAVGQVVGMNQIAGALMGADRLIYV